jgi:phosphoenolpyruvate-protein phosphotransferase (PTS system enzyme I)
MGLRSFSMHPARMAIVKQRVLRADTRACAALRGGATSRTPSDPAARPQTPAALAASTESRAHGGA